MPAPLRCTHTVCLRDEGRVQDSRERFAAFCSNHGQSGPGERSRHHLVHIGNCLMKWEGHTEADSYTVLVAGNSEPPFATTALDFLDQQTQDRLLGRLFVGIHVEILPGDDFKEASRMKRLRNLLGAKDIYGGSIAAGKGRLWSSFRLDGAGFQRLVMIDRGLGEGRLSRMLSARPGKRVPTACWPCTRCRVRAA